MDIKPPVHLGDLTGPSGNVFAIIGQLKRTAKHLERAGITVAEEAQEVVEGFTSRTYEETLDLIEEHWTTWTAPSKSCGGRRVTEHRSSPAPLQGVQSMAYALQALHDKKIQDVKNFNVREAKTRRAVENMIQAIERGSLDTHLKSLVEVILWRAEDIAVSGDDRSVSVLVDTFDKWAKDRRADAW